MEAFEGYYDTFIETQDMSGLIEEYNANLVNLGNEVCVLDPAGEYRGVSEGIKQGRRAFSPSLRWHIKGDYLRGSFRPRSLWICIRKK